MANLVAVAGIVVLTVLLARRALAPSSTPPSASKVATKPVKPPAVSDANAAASPATKDADTPQPAAAEPSPSAPRNESAAAPNAAVDKTEDVVAARPRNDPARIETTVAGGETPDRRALDTPPAGRSAGQSPPPSASAAPALAPGSVSEIAPGVTATRNDVIATPKASPAFRRFVADARITGVFQGNPPRAFINGRIVRAGEVIDQDLGVVFESIDAENKTITFKNRAGVTVVRKY